LRHGRGIESRFGGYRSGIATVTVGTTRRGLPPGPSSGRFAQAAAFHRDPLGFLRGVRAEFGDTFTVRLAVSGPMVVFTDRAVVDEIAEIPREVGHAGAARRRIVQMISERSVLGADSDDHRVRRERLEPAFAADIFDERRDEMMRIAESHLTGWPTGRPFRVLPRMRRIVDDIFVRLALGVRDEKRAQALAAATYRMLWTPGNPPVSPPGRYAGVLGAAGKLVFDRRKAPAARLLSDEIEAQRAGVKEPHGVIGAMVRATPGKPTDELVDELLPLLMAGQEPPAAGLTWILDRLARNPELAEHFLSSPPDDPLRTATVREALRLRPAVHSVARRLSEPRVIGGYELPAGMTANVPIVLLHRDPVAFREPDEFRPERFLERDVDGLAFLPFGGGPRVCLGRWLARAEIGTVIPAILRALELKPLSREPERMVVRGTVLVPQRGELAVARAR
jgi:cytochrome P450 family 135